MNVSIKKIPLIQFYLFKLLIKSVSILVLTSASLRAEEMSTDWLILSQARQNYVRGDYNRAILLLNDLLQKPQKIKTSSISAHSDLAEIYRHLGQYSQAIAHWQKAIELVQTQNTRLQKPHLTKLSQLKVDLARAYIYLGQANLAIPLLQEAFGIAKQAQKAQKTEIENAAQRSLGDAYRISGEYDKAIAAYTNSLEKTQSPEINTKILNGLVDVYQLRSQQYFVDARGVAAEGDLSLYNEYIQLAETDRIKAQEAAKRAVELSKSLVDVVAVRALINFSRLSPAKVTTADFKRMLSIVERLPASRSKVYLAVNLARLKPQQAVETLNQAVATASKLGDRRALSFASGALGNAYEQKGKLKSALFWTQQAELAAQEVTAIDSLYRWQWQAGRLYRAMGAEDAAKNAYRGAIASVQSIRNDLLNAEEKLQLDFRSEVEPAYREYLGLLLQDGNQAEIEEALAIADLLQISQLQSFFGDDCVEIESNLRSNRASATEGDRGTAIIRSIILKDRTYMILRLSDGTIKSYPVDIKSKQLQAAIDNWRYSLEDLATDSYLPQSQSLYDLLIRPLAKDLTANDIKKIIFVNDGRLRNVPMTALHDGQNFLIEKYAASYSLGLDRPNQSNLDRDKLKALVFGLTVSANGFPALTNIQQEINSIAKFIDVDRFLNKKFVRENFQKQLDSAYPIVHLATHAKFGGSSENAFIQAFNQEISLTELETTLSKLPKPVELLVLSACETAAGNNRSVLGLAGIALRTNVNSVLGSLWAVNDAQTANLMENFYQNLSIENENMNESEALRAAQLEQIKQPLGHPGIWSSFIVIR